MKFKKESETNLILQAVCYPVDPYSPDIEFDIGSETGWPGTSDCIDYDWGFKGKY